jgi:AraC-like DNA-binding protein
LHIALRIGLPDNSAFMNEFSAMPGLHFA